MLTDVDDVDDDDDEKNTKENWKIELDLEAR